MRHVSCIFFIRKVLSPLPQVNRIRGERVEKRTYKTIENNGSSEKLTRTFKSGELKTHTKIIYKYIYYKGQTIPGRQLVFISKFMEKIYI